MTRDTRTNNRGIPTHNDREQRTDALKALTDTPEARALRVAHPFGTNYVRYDAERAQWRSATLRPSIEGGTMWCERRIYPARLHTLLAESEFSVVPRADYPETFRDA